MAGDRAASRFTPALGAPRRLAIDRGRILRRFETALDTGPTHPDYTLLITGERDAGKTALLNELESRCALRGRLSIFATASAESLSTRLTSDAQHHLAALRAQVPRQRRIPGSSTPGIGAGTIGSVQPDDPDTHASLLSTLECLSAELQAVDRGLLIAVDDLHDADRDQVRDVATAVQIVTRRQQRPLAFAATALTYIEGTHLADRNMTFFQRCARARLGTIDAASSRSVPH